MTSSSLRVLTATTLAFLALPPCLTAQDSSAASAPYLVYLRAGATSPTYGYVLYNVGKGVFGAGVLADWRNAYREFAAGAGLNLYSANGNGATVMAAVADASDSWYLQLWVFPTVVTGRLSLTGFGGVYVPAEGVGVWQYFFDPATIFWRVGGPIAIGAAYSGYKIENLPARHGVGPAMQIAIPHGSATVELLRELRNFDDDVRVTMQFTF